MSENIPPLQTETMSPQEILHLRNYLSSAIYENIEKEAPEPTQKTYIRSIHHLRSLLEATTSHLPAYLVEQVAANPIPGLAGGQFVDGTLLFADISGFTAMSERLSQIGREGAEEVTVVVNRYFDVMLEILRDYEGQLIRFGGDALLGLFAERPLHTIDEDYKEKWPFDEVPNSATLAAQAAVKMQSAMSQFAETKTSIGTFPLRMSVGVHQGRFFAAQLGTAENMEFALFGKDVNETAAIESAAQAGQVVVDRQTFAAIDQSLNTVGTPVAEHPDYLLIDIPQIPPIYPIVGQMATHYPLPPTIEELRRHVRLLDALTPYLPAGLLARLSSDPLAPSLKGEHRLVASLFANIEGLGAIADRLGPGNEERIVTALNEYFVRMDRALTLYGGVVNKIDLYDHGDKLLVTFGAPIIHEDDAERAVRAAFAMQTELAEIATAIPETAGLPDLVLEQRIGISYAFVFSGYLGASWRHEYTVMGDEVNLAARLMSIAETGQIIVNPNVHRLTESIAELPLLGEVNLKGKSEPVPIYEVKGLKSVQQRVRGVAGMHSQLVGRTDELAEVQTAVSDLHKGKGKIVSIIGEAGMGKSRFLDELDVAKTIWLHTRCFSYTESVSYRPMQLMLRQLLGLNVTDEEDAAASLSQLQTSLSTLFSAEEVEENVPYVANFLNISLTAVYTARIQYLDGEALQRRTFIAIRDCIAAQAEQTPLIVALDNVHWLDNASFNLLHYLLPLVESSAVLFIFLFRPERNKGCWTLKEKVAAEYKTRAVEIVLTGLSSEDSEQLLRNLVPVSHWPVGSIDLILNRAEGNPLYLEEVLRSLINDGLLQKEENGRWQFSESVQEITVPDTLEGVLLARLDRLEELCRWTVQVASVVGRSFPLDVLSHATAESGDLPVNRYMTELETVEIIREMQNNPEYIYSFMHSLMQEVSYSSLALSSRRHHHRLIAAYLEDSRKHGWGSVENVSPLIAHHAFEGEDWERALTYQLRAGIQAQSLFANEDAIDHFVKALHAAEQLQGNDTEQLKIHLALGQLYVETGQYDLAATHLDQAQQFAVALADGLAETAVCRWQAGLYEQKGDYPQAIQWIEKGTSNEAYVETTEYAQMLLLAGLINIRQGEPDKALEAVEPVLKIAEEQNAITVLARAKSLIGIAYYSHSNNDAAIENYQTSYELYHQAGDVRGEATAHNLIANVYFNLGQWGDADFHYQQALTMFDRIGDIYNRALTQNNLGGIAKNQGRFADAIQFYTGALQSIEKIGGSVWIIGAFHMNLGATYVHQGDPILGLQHLELSQSFFAEAQSRDFLPEVLRHMAEAHILMGAFVDARTKIDEALSLGRELNARGEEGCALRVQGQIALSHRELEQARTLTAESVAILEEIADEYELARSRMALAGILGELGEIEAGVEQLTLATAVFKRLDASADLQKAKTLQAKLGI